MDDSAVWDYPHALLQFRSLRVLDNSGRSMKKLLAATTVLVALPLVAQAQSLQPGGFYIGAEGGVSWLLSSSSNATVSVPGVGFGSFGTNLSWNTGWTAGGMIGYDFIGPRVELEARFLQNNGTLTVPGTAL